MRNMKMLKTERGSPDGAHVFTYEKGQVYALPEVLAGIFEQEGAAREAAPDAASAAPVRADGPVKSDAAATPDFAKMTKAALQSLARDSYDADLANSLSKADMVAELTALHAAKAKAASTPPTGAA